jgi:hypothetical protein
MDVVTKMIAAPAALWATVVGLVALLPLGFGIYWLFNKQARLRDLAELRKKLDELSASDPEYGAVRALYTSMMVDAERWGFIKSGSGPSTAVVIMWAMAAPAVITDVLSV